MDIFWNYTIPVSFTQPYSVLALISNFIIPFQILLSKWDLCCFGEGALKAGFH